jgi:uncharacterized protein (DUF2237 family)
MSKQKNVFGEDLQLCSFKPLTGYFRDGCCNTDSGDLGLHVVCAEVTEQFLEYSKSRGNDLSTPNPDVEFPGLKPGDRWCLCALRWKEALDAGVAPPVILSSTNEKVLEIIELKDLKRYAIDVI